MKIHVCKKCLPHLRKSLSFILHEVPTKLFILIIKILQNVIYKIPNYIFNIILGELHFQYFRKVR